MQLRPRVRGAARTAALALGIVLPQLVFGTATSAQNIDYAGLNAALVENYVLPRYADFAAAAGKLEDSLAQACSDGRLEAAESAEAYHAAMDAWMGVQHMRFGPSELFLRAQRVEFWPDTRGMVRRHLAQLLSNGDPKALEPQTFAAGSVAVQGFPALERLMYDSDDEVWSTPFGCRTVTTIGRNLNTIASNLLADWRDGPEAYAEVVRTAAGGNENYFDAKEASLEFAKSLRGALMLVSDYKLGRPLGDAPDARRLQRAESWRSARSLHNVAINLAAARALYEGAGAVTFSALVRAQPKGAELDQVVRDAFDRLVTAAEALPESYKAAFAEEEGWQKLDALRVESHQLLELLGGPLSEVLDLPIGFNSYDGD